MLDRSDLDRLAYAGAELPEELGYGDALYYLMLRALYQFAKATDMDPERGRREKAKMEEAVRRYRADEWSAMVRALQFRDTSAARADYRKARMGLPLSGFTPQVSAMLSAADRMAAALDNIPISPEGE